MPGAGWSAFSKLGTMLRELSLARCAHSHCNSPQRHMYSCAHHNFKFKGSCNSGSASDVIEVDSGPSQACMSSHKFDECLT